jgi:solute carrier family 13 (sodium-dependent dicarboxylate transporter), member 2/3/5
MSNPAVSTRKIIMWAATLLLPLLILTIPVTGSFTQEMQCFFAVTLFVIFLWAFELMPFVIPAILLPVLYLVTGIATPAAAFAPWGHYIPWMLLAGMILTHIFDDAGLLRRISYWAILKTGGSFGGLLYGLMISGIIIALILPDIASRAVLFVAISFGICKALKLPPFSKRASAVMLAGIMSALTPSYIYYTSAAQTLMAWEAAKAAGFSISWLQYLLYNGFPTLVWCFVTILIIQLMFGGAQKESYKAYFEEEYRKMGGMNAKEKKLAILSLALCLFVILESYHGIAVGWGFVAAVFICYLPGINLGTEHSYKDANYALVIFVASCMAIGAVSNQLGAGIFIAELLQPFISGGLVHTVAASWLMAVILNFVMTPLAAVACLSGPLAGIVSANPESAIVPVMYAWNQGLEQIILPYEYALILLAFGYGYISLKHFIGYFSVRMVANILFILVFCIPFWLLVGAV